MSDAARASQRHIAQSGREELAAVLARAWQGTSY
jgi:hypothetical protein